MRAMLVLRWCSLVFLAACAAEVETSAREAARQESIGILQIERAPSEGPNGRVSQSVIGAAFARYQGMTGRDVVQMLGVGGLAPLERCVPAAGAATPASASVELLDVGALDVAQSAGDAHVRLLARTFPELGGIASGLFYAGNASFSGETGSVYTFRASGGAQIAPFEVAVAEPGDIEGLRVDGVFSEQSPSIARGTDAELRWDARDARDTLEVEVQDGHGAITCTALDDGSFRLPASATSALRPGSGRLILRRVHVEPFDVDGVDAAYARVVATHWYALVVR